MSSAKISNPVAKTWFAVLWDKSIENMGIKVNWNDLDYMAAQLETAFSDISPNFYATICNKPKENGEAGYHVHAVIYHEKAKRLKSIADLLGNGHCELLRGSKDEAIAYINKEGKFAEKGESILKHIGDPAKIKDNSGLRFDIVAIEQYIASGSINASNLDSQALRLGSTLSQIEGIKSLYRHYMLANAPKKPRKVEVIYIEGEPRTGKTYGAYKLYDDIFRVDTDPNSQFQFNGYLGQKTILLNELRPGMFKASFLFDILEGYPINVNVKGGYFPALWERVIITTAFPLDDWFNDTEEYKQDNLRKQFRGRIHKHYWTVVDERDINGLVTASHYEDYDTYKKRQYAIPMSETDIADCPFL